MVSNREDIDKAVQIGANFLVYSVDTFIIHSAVKHAVSQLPILNR
jgi:2-keto-3-deoxy-L-rhamnonate aldolase RhmA